MITLEKIIRKRDMYRARVELMKMLTELSDDAIEYVWRPIAYAWHYTDFNDPDVMTEEDLDRMCLVGAVAHGSQTVIYRSCLMCRAAQNGEREKKAAKNGKKN